MSKACPKDLRQLIKECERRGWITTLTNGGHIRWEYTNGMTMISAQTPSDFRAIKNIKSNIRKIEQGKQLTKGPRDEHRQSKLQAGKHSTARIPGKEETRGPQTNEGSTRGRR